MPTGIPKLDGAQIALGTFLIGEPSPRPDLGPDKFASLANMNGELVLVELSIKLDDLPNAHFSLPLL
jgi:hypothetical protein